MAAIALVKSSNKNLFSALSNCIGNGIPSLARASLFTVAWLSRFLHSLGDENLLSMACSILAPQLLESSSYDRVHEEQALASFSLECLTKSSGIIYDFCHPRKFANDQSITSNLITKFSYDLSFLETVVY